MSDIGAGLGGAPSLAGAGAVRRADQLTEAEVRQRSRGRRVLLLGIGVFVILSAVRLVTDNPDLTSSGTFGATLRLAVPIGLAALGGIYSERSGVVNIGLEGMMILGTWFGAWGAWEYGPWWGVAIGILGGAMGGLLHAVATVTFNVDHIISGVAIITLAQGVSRYLSVTVYEDVPGGGATQSPRVEPVGTFDVPILAGGDLFGWDSPDILGWLEDHHWFLISDLAGLLRGFANNLSYLTLIALLLVPFTWWLLWRTVFGLRLRSCGEYPTAADSLGVPVYRMKYAGVVISGALAGLGGAFLAIEAAGIYRQGQTGGRGFIGLAAMIFGNWRPFGAAAGAGLFGFADALQLRDEQAVHALLLFVGVLAAAYAVVSLVRRRWLAASLSGLVALVVTVSPIGYYFTDAIEVEFISMTPYLVTLLVLALATQRLRMPAADGQRWRKGGGD
jgi:simple sugar transport system permease protein